MKFPADIERVRLNETGLSLVEVLLGVVILGVAVAPVAALLGGTFQGSGVQVSGARALHLAQGKLEEVLALDYGDLAPGTPLSDRIAAPDSIDRYVLITMNPGELFDSRIKQVSVTVGAVTVTCYRTDAFEP